MTIFVRSKHWWHWWLAAGTEFLSVNPCLPQGCCKMLVLVEVHCSSIPKCVTVLCCDIKRDNSIMSTWQLLQIGRVTRSHYERYRCSVTDHTGAGTERCRLLRKVRLPCGGTWINRLGIHHPHPRAPPPGCWQQNGKLCFSIAGLEGFDVFVITLRE